MPGPCISGACMETFGYVAAFKFENLIIAVVILQNLKVKPHRRCLFFSNRDIYYIYECEKRRRKHARNLFKVVVLYSCMSRTIEALSRSLSIYLSVNLSVSFSFCLSLSITLPPSLCVCVSVCLSVCLSLCLSQYYLANET